MSGWVGLGLYMNLSTLSHGNLTINTQSNYHVYWLQILYHKYESQNMTEY
jgi:hypothetical protein